MGVIVVSGEGMQTSARLHLRMHLRVVDLCNAEVG